MGHMSDFHTELERNIVQKVRVLDSHLNRKRGHYKPTTLKTVEELIGVLVETAAKLDDIALLNVKYYMFEHGKNLKTSTTHIPLTYINRNHIYDIVTQGPQSVVKDKKSGSDVQQHVTFCFPSDLSVTFQSKFMQKTRNTHSGGYMRYTIKEKYWPLYDALNVNGLMVDLQIYKTPLINAPRFEKKGECRETDPTVYLDDNIPCFANSIGPELASQLGEYRKERQIPRNRLNDIYALIDRNINLHYIKTENKKDQETGKKTVIKKSDVQRFPDDAEKRAVLKFTNGMPEAQEREWIDVCLYEDHYFKYYTVPYFGCAIDHPDALLEKYNKYPAKFDMTKMTKWTKARGVHYDRSKIKATNQYTTLKLVHDMMEAGWFERIGFNKNAMSFLDKDDEEFKLLPEHFEGTAMKWMVPSRHSDKEGKEYVPPTEREMRDKHIKVSLDIESGINVQKEERHIKDRHQPISIGITREYEDWAFPYPLKYTTTSFRIKAPRTEKSCNLHIKDLVRKAFNHLTFRRTDPEKTHPLYDEEGNLLSNEPEWIPLTEKEQKKKVFVFIHNMKYDLSVLLPYFPNQGVTFTGMNTKDGAYYTFEFMYGGRRIVFVDSFKMISEPLSKFGKMFHLDQDKDICPYTLYTGDVVYKDSVPIEDLLPEHFNKQSEYDQMMVRLAMEQLEKTNQSVSEYYDGEDETMLKRLTEEGLSLKFKPEKHQTDIYNANRKVLRKRFEDRKVEDLKEYGKLMQQLRDLYTPAEKELKAQYSAMMKRILAGTVFRHMDYLDKYMRLDCEVLIKGVRARDTTLKAIIREITQQSKVRDLNPEYLKKLSYMDTLGCYTAASFAHHTMLYSGAYNNHMAFSGPLRKWLDRVIGGRTTLACPEGEEIPMRHITKSEGESGVEIKTHTKTHNIRQLKGKSTIQNNALTIATRVAHHHGFKLCDADATSLYPTAMANLEYFPVGAPVLFTGAALEELQEKPYYVAEVRLKESTYKMPEGRKTDRDWACARQYYDIPLLCYKDNGVLNWFNKLPKKIKVTQTDKGEREIEYIPNDTTFTLDRATFEDLKRHNVFLSEDFELVQGIYWENKDPSISGGLTNDARVLKDTIDSLFSRRLALKAKMKTAKDGSDEYVAADALQGAMKLVMNSSYGKLAMAASDSELRLIEYKDGEGNITEKYQRFLTKNRESIKDFTPLDGGNVMKVTLYANSYESYNSAHLAQCVLANSKVIMNRVTCLFPRNTIVYTDTDSIQCDLDAFEAVQEAFMELYEYKLTGEKMLNFHNDVDKYCKEEVQYCSWGIYVAKKCYVTDKRNDTNIHLDPEDESRYHIRYKGVPKKELKVERQLPDPMGMYTKMVTGEYAPVPTVSHIEDGKPVYDYGDCFQVAFRAFDITAKSEVNTIERSRMFRG
ncbi:DNA-directed DNA polymerase, family B [Kipferlia bialata]|uniref:DNA-directed DNA polymerase n=1 Tax=Kipferlia bialata TaxID=797122 RepID=A0A391NST4_9EUKA|nr:DNA-directed DNA polymerase, family B [Kipferlia bialata]|eukprot:g8018.t1